GRARERAVDRAGDPTAARNDGSEGGRSGRCPPPAAPRAHERRRGRAITGLACDPPGPVHPPLAPVAAGPTAWGGSAPRADCRCRRGDGRGLGGRRRRCFGMASEAGGVGSHGALIRRTADGATGRRTPTVVDLTAFK